MAATRRRVEDRQDGFLAKRSDFRVGLDPGLRRGDEEGGGDEEAGVTRKPLR